jgi:hypothetical protein
VTYENVFLRDEWIVERHAIPGPENVAVKTPARKKALGVNS